MTVELNLPISRDDLLFTVEMALRKAGKRWPTRHRPVDRDWLKPVARAALDLAELWATCCFGKSPGHGPMAAPGGAAGRGG